MTFHPTDLKFWIFTTVFWHHFFDPWLWFVDYWGIFWVVSGQKRFEQVKTFRSCSFQEFSGYSPRSQKLFWQVDSPWKILEFDIYNSYRISRRHDLSTELCFAQNTCPNFGQIVLREKISKMCGSSVFSTILIGVLSIFNVKTAMKYHFWADFGGLWFFSKAAHFFCPAVYISQQLKTPSVLHPKNVRACFSEHRSGTENWKWDGGLGER